MKILVLILSFLILFFSCKKAEDRDCFKSYGELTQLEYSIDSVQEFKLYEGIEYRFYQNNSRKIIVKGGRNVVNFIDINSKDFITSINNLNSCNFLRDYDDKIIVEIHYPHYHSIYAEPTEPMRFIDTLTGDYVTIKLKNGGESLDLNVNIKSLYLKVSIGTSNINVYGTTNDIHLSTQNFGRINALGVVSNSVFVHQGSATDMLVNFSNSKAIVNFFGNGDVLYLGVPTELTITGQGDGEVLTY